VKILIVSDTWRPQLNGVASTLEMTVAELARMGHEARVVGPDAGRRMTFQAPFSADIKLEFFAKRRLKRIFEEFRPDYIHIASEGPLGWAARRVCLRFALGFSTAYHTRYPEYVAARVPRPLAGLARRATYALLKRFHAPSNAIMVATASLERDLHTKDFSHLKRWSRGVDLQLFRPYGKELSTYAGLDRPVLLYVGRLAVEKNVRTFLSLPTPGTKVVIGDGPDAETLKLDFPEVRFLGPLRGEALARHYAAADLFVFPSTTDTFGLVLLEACASGLRIAAMSAPGPLDIFGGDGDVATLDCDLGSAVARALKLPENCERARAFAKKFNWAACTEEFYENLRAAPARVR
jgi:glycosyltransferase involved in cell wall biosynthesis